MGHAPSFTWRLILEARDLLVAGIRWKIGDKLIALISGHPWLPRPASFQLIAKPKMLQQLATIVARTFLLYEHNSCHKLTKYPSWDEMIWYYDKPGRLTVRSSYALTIDTESPTTTSNVEEG
ncbi:hypothetical protein Salat_1856700 [Sesamum alatum]|uniref:Uncharacterized protein n=1 Tax=Sesamum alatum TaxID=300844 RepID=A0AAE1Y3T2_9LAMI|nr:hypothetical protein Salat_1856700 [Sesamum alatum]